MEATILQRKKKIIDLKGDTFRSLSVMAEEYDDNKAYAWLVENRPEGQVLLNETEKEDFENWLGV